MRELAKKRILLTEQIAALEKQMAQIDVKLWKKMEKEDLYEVACDGHVISRAGIELDKIAIRKVKVL